MKIFLVPPPGLPVPAVQGGAVETLLTGLLEQNEQYGQLELVCASLPDKEARARAAQYQHGRVLYLERPDNSLAVRLRREWGRRTGRRQPDDPWYLAVEQAIETEQPDLVIGEGGDLTELAAISRRVGKARCLAHLHGHTEGSARMDDIYGGVLALSGFIRQAYLQRSTLSPARAKVLYNGIDTGRFCPVAPERRQAARHSFGFPDDAFVVIFCGRLAEDKGIHRLLEAMPLCPPSVRLLIVGSSFFGAQQEDEFTQRLRRLAQPFAGRICFTGYLPQERLPDCYAAADCACVPTLVEEAAGLFAIESMACGLPVIATQSGGMPEYLAGSDAVLLPRTEDLAADIARAVTALYRDPERRAAMSAAGPRRAADFSLAQYYRSFTEQMNELGG